MTRQDVQGNVRIWDATQESHLLKLQTRPISSRVNDIAWDSESKRLIAVGDGKERCVVLLSIAFFISICLLSCTDDDVQIWTRILV
jgi:WD40 repeat protein